MIDIFDNCEFNESKLIEYGFIKEVDDYLLKKTINDDKFELRILITKNNKISLKLIEKDTDEEYVLYKISMHTGKFVSGIRLEIENILIDIKEKCCNINIFKTRQAQEIITYIREKYDSKLEFLWDKFPNNAIFRRKDNNKWYGAILKIPKNKLGFLENDKIEILNLKEKDLIIDNIKIFPGYHMNKKYWISIILDDKLSTKEIYNLIDKSYILANK